MTEPPSEDPFSAPQFPDPQFSDQQFPGAPIGRPAGQRRLALTIIGAVVTLAVVGVLLAIVVINKPSKSKPAAPTSASTTAAVLAKVRTVPAAALAAIGPGHAVGAPQPIKEKTPLVSSGKPELLFIGAEFCPYCAAERWAIGVALSRFGTLNGVTLTQSSSTDTDPNTSTLDFLHATYTSQYLSFVPVENEDRNHKLLEAVTKSQNAVWARYSPHGQGYPFLDFGNSYVLTGPNLDPAVLAGLSQAQIASRLGNPADPVALSVDGAANVLTASICGMTNNQPATVCNDPTISGIKAKIDALPVTKPASTG